MARGGSGNFIRGSRTIKLSNFNYLYVSHWQGKRVKEMRLKISYEKIICKKVFKRKLQCVHGSGFLTRYF